MERKKVIPRNRMAQLLYRATGNPPGTLPSSAISNCFPGLEFDFKAFWRRVFEGIVLLEWDNYVIEADPKHNKLVGHRLLRVGEYNLTTTVFGPVIPDGTNRYLPADGSPGIVTMEWSNALAYLMTKQGRSVTCYFTKDKAPIAQPLPEDLSQLLDVELTVRQLLHRESASPSKDLLLPGELTQGLCSPWQHDFRECSCYYWPASRPDYINIEPTAEGTSKGDNWLAKKRTGSYVLDDRRDSRLVSYDELFLEWEKMLQFEIEGRDST
jgi:hypothetical protein